MDTNNPVGLDGVSFVEFAGTDSMFFENLFLKWGFLEISKHPTKNIKLFKQNDINFIVNSEPGTFAYDFAKKHGPSVSSTGFRTLNAQQAMKVSTQRGGKEYQGSAASKGVINEPAIYGIGDSLIYFMDSNSERHMLEQTFGFNPAKTPVKGVGFEIVDHFTNNVPKGEMQKWCDFYINIFNFRETRYFNIQGAETGLLSKVMRSPCNKFAVPINEPADGKSQIQEYLDEYKGSGIQHLALLTSNIVQSLHNLKNSQLEFLTPPPDAYYKMLSERVPNVTEHIPELQKNAILVDGDDKGYLLQIFSKNIIGPIFFEVIQRKNHFGFGEGNFQALFDSIERDQKERGYL
jgi:4-hydroxyphenylpyruvate dioxygenase